MSFTTTSLSLPLIQANQAQKHVTHNESLMVLDALTHLRLTDISLSTPPAIVPAGSCFFVAGTGTGDWTGQDGKVAVFEDGGWTFFTPLTGWLAWDLNGATAVAFDGSGWSALASGGGGGGTGGSTLGVNTTADATNRLAVSSDAVLFTHDSSGDQQIKVNKSATTNTASLLFQTNWTGHAEMGTSGSNDFAIKTSADGSTFNTALIADAATGQVSFPNGATGLSDPAFGTSPLATVSHSAARGQDLVSNGGGHLGTGYNVPSGMGLDSSRTPNLPGAMRFNGRYTDVQILSEPIAVDPNRVFQLSTYISQDDIAGDWSAFTEANRHAHDFGCAQFDADWLLIEARHHMRFRSGGTDSETVLAAPLAPGDTIVDVVDASGWNDEDTADYARGLIIFGYANGSGQVIDSYSRLVEFDLFDIANVDKSNNRITLSAGLPASLGNPDDANGIWPVGTVIANSFSGETYKFNVLDGYVPPSVEDWFDAVGFVGGIDRSGTNKIDNFAPGTAFVRPAFRANFSNRVGGFDGHPDTGTTHAVRFAGVSMQGVALATQSSITAGANSGAVNLEVPFTDYGSAVISMVPAAPSTRQV